MKILAIDTSSPCCSVAIIDEHSVIAHFSIHIEKTHSETLLPLIDSMLQYTNISLKEMDAFACCIGPGSFTGIRIGIATIKGFALSLNKPVISVSALEGLAYNVPSFEGYVCGILNANHRNVYAGLYQGDKIPSMIGDYYTDSIEGLIQNLQQYDQKIMFVGDGAVFYQEDLQKAFGEKAVFVSSFLSEQSAISIARAAIQKYSQNIVETADELHPLYLRKSQAERLYDATHEES